MLRLTGPGFRARVAALFQPGQHLAFFVIAVIEPMGDFVAGSVATLAQAAMLVEGADGNTG